MDVVEPGDHSSALSLLFRAPQHVLACLRRGSAADLVAAGQAPAGDDVAGLTQVAQP